MSIGVIVEVVLTGVAVVAIVALVMAFISDPADDGRIRVA